MTPPVLSARARATRGAMRWLVVLGTAGMVAACSSYVRKSTEIRDLLARAQYEQALKKIDDISTSNSRLLLLYEKGLVLHCEGRYEESNAAFEQAEEVLEDLYTKSVTRQLASMTVSETIAQYRGDAFEAVLVNYYKILNYLALDDVDGAMVECRRVNHKLQMLQDGGETYFVNDPFLQYLTAMVYAMGGELTDADVSYRTATDLYADSTFTPVVPAPPSLYCDAGFLERAIGDRQAADSLLARASCPPPDGAGRVNILLECGEIVQKGEANAVIPIFESDRWDDNERFAHELENRYHQHYNHPPHVKYWLKVSLPTLAPRPPLVARAVVHARPADDRRSPGTDADAVIVENLDAYAAQAFQEKESTVLVRAIVRGLTKYVAFTAARDKNEGLGALVNILNITTETADTRSWSTLPQSIWMARLQLPPGRYTIEADLFAPDGSRVGDVTFTDVDVRDGRMEFRKGRVF